MTTTQPQNTTSNPKLSDLDGIIITMIARVAGRIISSIHRADRLVEDLGIDSIDIVDLGLEIEQYLYKTTGHTVMFPGSNPLIELGTVQKVLDYLTSYARKHGLYQT